MSDIQKIDRSLIDEILNIIKRESGIVIREERLTDFEIVVRGRMITNKLSPVSYAQFLKETDDELVILASFFTIQETSFYRNKNHFDRLRCQILPELIEKKYRENNKKIVIFLPDAPAVKNHSSWDICMMST